MWILSRALFSALLIGWTLPAISDGIGGSVTPQGGGGINQFDGGISFNGSQSPFLLLDGTAPVAFADFTTEGTSNHYYLNGAQSANFAAWMTAVGGTFARAGSATYLQGGVIKTATTGVARFPTSLAGTPLGIRLTPSATNSVFQSNGFLTTWTLASGGAPVQNVAGPDAGGSTGWTLTASANVGAALNQTVVITTPQFLSVFAKGGTSCFAYLSETDAGGTKTTWFNACTGAIGTANSTTAGAPTIAQGTPPTPQQLANGWWLFGVPSSGASTASVTVGQSDADASTAAATNNTLFIFGAEGTKALYQADYIPTTTIAVTQPADDLHTTVTWYNATSSTLFVDYIIDNPGNASPELSGIWDQGLSQNVISLRGANSGTLASVTSGAASQWTGLSGAAVVAGVRSRSAIALTASNFGFSKNGANPFLSQASGAVPVGPTRFALGVANGGLLTSGNFRQVGYWGIRGSNAGIQAITSQ